MRATRKHFSGRILAHMPACAQRMSHVTCEVRSLGLSFVPTRRSVSLYQVLDHSSTLCNTMIRALNHLDISTCEYLLAPCVRMLLDQPLGRPCALVELSCSRGPDVQDVV